MGQRSHKRLTALIVLIFSLVIAELLVRLILFQPFIELPSGLNGYATTLHLLARSESSDLRWVPIRNLVVATERGLRIRPSVNLVLENEPLAKSPVLLRTNELALRAPALSSSGSCRTLFLGDSVTFSSYLNEEDTFVAKIGQSYRKRGVPLETLNAAFLGYGLRDEIALLEETVTLIKPRVVILQTYLNDALPPQPTRILTAPILNESWLLGHIFGISSVFLSPYMSESDPNETVLRQWYSEMQKNLAALKERNPTTGKEFQKLVQDNFSDWGNAWSASMWQFLRPGYERFRDLSQQHGFLPIVIMSPLRVQVEEPSTDNYPQLQLQKITSDLKLPFLDLLPALKKTKPQDGALFLDHCHYSAAGHIALEKIITDFLDQNGIREICR